MSPTDIPVPEYQRGKMTVGNPENFNVSDVKLEGKNLIEAAAGTGKTYSIAIMVLRWILETENKIDSVLAVTFTNYATAELKDRILSFLEEALDCFEIQDSQNDRTDKTIKTLCEKFADKKKAAAKLRAAINDFDTASIFTIHGFCRKLIHEHAFELGIDFDMKLSEETDTASDAVTTFFRENISDSTLFDGNEANLLENKDFRDKLSREELKDFISKAGIGIENKNIKTNFGIPAFDEKLTEIYKNLAEKAAELARKNRDNKNVMGYDDILLILYEVLKENKCSIKKSMDERYSLVLIDEFQDTDPLQHFIFKQLFLNGRHTVFFIGDPKQSIYAFRKADIFTYFEAAEEVDKIYVMKTNFRSSPAAVEAANEVFNCKNIFGDDSLIKYEPVSAAKKAGEYALLLNGSVFHGMLVREIPDNYRGQPVKNQEILKEILTGHMSQAISEMIKKDSSFKIREKIKNGQKEDISERPVKPSDITVLVAQNDFALKVCQKLEDAGIPAAVETDTAKELYIFSSEEAVAMQKLILAASTKGFAEFKTLLPTFFYNKTVDDIADGNNSFSDLYENFRSCFAEWEEKGFYPAFSKFIENRDILANIAIKGEKTERTIGILRQLSELIHKYESENGFSALGTRKWFDDKIKAKSGTEEENIRDEGGKKECVRIMTLHKSKGLEFNIVFFPLILKTPTGKQWFTRHNKTENGYEREMIFMPAKEAAQIQTGELPDDEKLEENRRIYVGITRAKYLTVCYTQRQKGYLEPTSLFQRENPEFIDTRLLKNNECETVCYENKDEAESETEFLPPETSRKIETSWAISSFSSINSRGQNESGNFENENTDPDESADRQNQDKTLKKEVPLADFPSGTGAGLVLHEILEKADFKSDDNSEIICSILKKKMNFKEVKSDDDASKSELDDRIEDVKRCLANVFSAPVFENGKTLRDIPESGKIAEMEFFIKIENNKLEKRNLSKIISDNYKAEELDDGTVKQGFLHGFIDLVAKIDGKYYIIDWKSNNLGSRFADYKNDSMLEEMKKHNYYLQYMLYLAAFDKYMTTVDSEYSYEKNFGGIRYIFLRGVQSESDKTGIFQDRPDEQKLRKIQRLLEEHA